ncbi:dipeptide ABC transporter ATP-binding protein [Escherichia coli]|nr:dipeptide ABC transporter ATP-binding protein [Escherichia coli]
MTWRWWAEAAHKIIVMYAGQVVETGDAHAIFHAPRHPVYSGIAACAARNLLRTKNVWRRCQVSFPASMTRPNGCLLNPRCPYATDKCRAEEPALNMLADGRPVQMPLPHLMMPGGRHYEYA